MKKYLSCILFLLFGYLSYAQIAPSKYLIEFTDKNNSPYSIYKPSDFLSQRAIDRRLRQGISITENDLPVNPFYVDSVRSTGVKILNTSKWVNSLTIQTTDSTKLEKILSFSFVKKLENVGKLSQTGSDNKMEDENDIMEPDPQYIEKCSLLSNNKSNAMNYGNSLLQVEMIGGTVLHNQGFMGDGMIIAVLDAGFYKVDELEVFDSLWMNDRIIVAKDFVNPEGNVFQESNHGMNVLSIMGGNKPGYLIGTAPHAKYLLLRSEDTGSEYLIEEYNWVSAAEYADSAGADIINSSLGYSVFWNADQDHTYEDMDGKTTPSTIGADIAASKGILVVNSAGNQGGTLWEYITAPSDGFNVISVGAVDYLEDYAPFSSVGPSYDGRIKPNVSAMGQGTIIASSDGSIISGNGTSFSSPIIAGMAACLWQYKTDATRYELIDAIEKSSSQYADPDSLLGYGIPDFALAKIILNNPKINYFDNDNSIDVFPNPFYDYLFVFFRSTGIYNVQLEIIDLNGKRIYLNDNVESKSGYNLFTINDLYNLTQGIYILKMSSNGFTAEKKIIKLSQQ